MCMCVWCNKLKLERETTPNTIRERKKEMHIISYQRRNTFLGGHDFFVISLSLSLKVWPLNSLLYPISFLHQHTIISCLCMCTRPNILRGSRNHHSTMRIRKRPPLCSPVPAPPPLSDLHLRRSEGPPEQTKTWGFPSYEEKMKQKEFGDDEGVMNSNNDIRKIVSICHGKEGFNTNNMLHQSSSSLQTEEDYDYKLVPLKKRKGNFERISTNEESKMSAKMKSKTNKKYGGEAVMEDGIGGSLKNRKKNKRGNVILEGSRCSRVNGRGWRCCQPTLVGYSLCEHHLGKGRLRITQPQPQPPSKKRSKVGVVKARSMSSLLSQI